MSNMNVSHTFDDGQGIVVYLSIEVDDSSARALYRNEVAWSEKTAASARDIMNWLIDGKEGIL